MTRTLKLAALLLSGWMALAGAPAYAQRTAASAAFGPGSDARAIDAANNGPLP